jgi:hypothetical protein
MSEVNASDTRKINGLEDVWALYTGAGRDDSKTGVETELGFFDPKSLDLAPMTVPQNKLVKNATNASCGGDFARNEPTSEMLEVGSIAVCPKSLRVVMDNLNARINCLTSKAADIGLKRSYFQHLPEKTAADLLKNLMDVPRYQAMWGPPREDMHGEAAYFSVCKSNQVSVSYFDTDHALSNVRRLYLLAPFLFLISENTAPFNEGKPFNGHQGMHHRASLKSRGGVPSFIFTAKTGDEYLRNHIDAVMNNPLFFYYDLDGNYTRLPSGQFITFKELAAQNLNTAGNYFFAQSVLWPDVKIAALKDEQGEVNGHRFEARMFGVGIHQHQTMLLLTAALAYDPAFAKAVDRLLEKFGFDQSKPESLKAPLMAAYKNAREHNGKFLQIEYGTGMMEQFAKDFAGLIEISPLVAEFMDELSPLLTILRTGWTDSKVNATLFNTLPKVLDFQRSHDPELFKNPNQCAYNLFERELREETNSFTSLRGSL